MKALIVSADGFEDSELLVPYYRFQEEGIDADIASLQPGVIKGNRGYQVEANLSVDQVEPEDYDLLLLPGGKAPAKLRKEKAVLEVARHFFRAHKPVAAICHGPQILISAGILKAKTATCYKSVAGEMREAEANYVDREVVVDENLITSRQPGDLPAFVRELMRMIKE